MTVMMTTSDGCHDDDDESEIPLDVYCEGIAKGNGKGAII
jgi:hypothetical protein